MDTLIMSNKKDQLSLYEQATLLAEIYFSPNEENKTEILRKWGVTKEDVELLNQLLMTDKRLASEVFFRKKALLPSWEEQANQVLRTGMKKIETLIEAANEVEDIDIITDALQVVNNLITTKTILSTDSIHSADDILELT